MGMVDKANELAAKHGWFLTPPVRERGQRRHALAHHGARDRRGLRRTTRLDYWVTGYGTGGTLKGVARVLAKERPEHQDRGVRAGRRADAEQRRSPQARNADGSPAAAHPAFKPHPMQGWAPDFIPKLTADAVDSRRDRTRSCAIAGPDAHALRRELAQKEGIFVGITAGATFAGALQVCAEAPKGATILCMLPDTGERYLSTPLFADIPADMTEEELEISRSTPAPASMREPSAGEPPHPPRRGPPSPALRERISRARSFFPLLYCERGYRGRNSPSPLPHRENLSARGASKSPYRPAAHRPAPAVRCS